MNDNSDKKAKIIKKYGLTSHFYDERYSKIQSEKYVKILKKIELKSHIILDAGCGTGLFYDHIFSSQKYDEKSKFNFVAIDISLKMLLLFHSKSNKKEKIHRLKINLILSDIENLPFRNGIFNSIFSLTSLQNLPSLTKGVNELMRVASEGAFLRLSILKKKINPNILIDYLKPNVVDLEVLIDDKIEDFLISFNLHKMKL